MKKAIALAAIVAGLPMLAQADYVCSPTVCAVKPFCGNASLPADGQHCAQPKQAEYCAWTTCRYGAKFQSWSWTVQPSKSRK